MGRYLGRSKKLRRRTLLNSNLAPEGSRDRSLAGANFTEDWSEFRQIYLRIQVFVG
ncbi:hypothetical protein LEP1GSC051_1224 [Leptospira sp. P2653]|nr:hypothetical protein LEP1GSC051_1224 [Leptospira sp. P2653]